MTFEEASKEAREWNSSVTLLPRANWVELHGRFSPDQLHAIADEISRRWKREAKPDAFPQ